MKLGYLGPRGTFSHEAAKLIKNDKHDLIEFRTIRDVVDALSNESIDEAIIPIENSIQGEVRESIDSIIEKNNIYVIMEKGLPIVQNLLCDINNSEPISKIYSHTQAIAQCQKFIRENYPSAEIIDVSSTATAAQSIVGKNGVACISNSACATEYNLKILNESIQDNNQNVTKFWLLSRNKNTNGSKMSLVFSTKNTPGALYKVLRIFYSYDINLTKIESRPAKTILGEYIFVIDIEINQFLETALKDLKEECKYLKVLGIY